MQHEDALYQCPQRYAYGMARRWTLEEETNYRNQLLELYEDRNLTIRGVGKILGISEKTVFDRMQRLDVPSRPHLKSRYLNRSNVVCLPERRSENSLK